MLGGLTGWHLLIILAVILLLFGAPKLPALAKSIGQSMRIFKGEVDEMKKDGKDGDASASAQNTTAQNTAPAAPAAPAPTAPGTDSTESKPKQ
ncbi:Sec-independent protein translocase subunit TatA [Leifsonia shinshuensis]|uniref:Sec-independent protein translocase protein TatA n=1 Tax=Leifsonia shinshuensis TaxID=150026 RepID=A0A7G6Y769_9MICO|nr:Sec-independent protein translocase subunit TatA [Leifsonia shinshuensis]QNE34334.1 twin-arginine translocase TatA/TatE family subunit [Leifsonia shinshuensis]